MAYVLIVDDHPFVAAATAREAASLLPGAETRCVESVASAEQAIARREQAPDFILLDRLPTIDIAHKLRAGVAGPGALITGHEKDGTGYPLRQTVDVDGQAGPDSVVINTTQNSDYIVNVHDTGLPSDGVDSLVINGTGLSEAFLLRSNFVAALRPLGGTGSLSFAISS